MASKASISNMQGLLTLDDSRTGPRPSTGFDGKKISPRPCSPYYGVKHRQAPSESHPEST
jgi:hypothetical protein